MTFVLVLAFTVTAFLSSAYRRARVSQGHRHYDIGQSLASAGNLEGAAEEYRKALLFLPDEPEYRLSLAVVLVELGKLDEAESHLQELLEINPTDGLVNLMMARIAERRNKTSQAIDYFERAVYGYWPRDKLPQRHAARWELVGLLEKQNHPNAVIGELLQLYANAPDDQAEKSKIGFMLLRYGATSDAVNVFRELVRDHANYVEGHHGLGEAYLDSRDYIAARREFQRAAHLDPNDRDNLNLLALSNSIIELDPDLPRLNAAARFHRSQLILERVLKNLTACSSGAPANDALKQEADNANKLLASKPADFDQAAIQMQDTASQLWKDRTAFCPSSPPNDRALEAVLSRISQ